MESIAGDEAAAAELDRLARLMEQQAILEKVPYSYIFARRFHFLITKKDSWHFLLAVSNR